MVARRLLADDWGVWVGVSPTESPSMVGSVAPCLSRPTLTHCKHCWGCPRCVFEHLSGYLVEDR